MNIPKRNILYPLLFLTLLSLLMLGCSAEKNPSNSLNPDIPPITNQQDTANFSDESSSSPQEVIHLSIASASSFNSLTGQLLEECVQQWELESGGRVHVALYGGSELGGDELLIEAVSQGTVSIVLMNINLHSAIVPEAALTSIPLTFDSLEQYNSLMNGSYGDIFKGYYQDKGLTLLANYAVSWQNLTTNVALKTAKDLSKLNIRIFSDDTRQLYWSACGTSPGTLAFSELYMALKDDIYNAQENSMEAVYANRFYEVQKYLFNSKHQMNIHSFLMNQTHYDALPEDVQQGLERFLQRFSAQYCAQVHENNESFMEKIIENGDMTLMELTPDIKQTMLEARKVVINKLKKDLGEDIVNEYLDAVDQILKQK